MCTKGLDTKQISREVRNTYPGKDFVQIVEFNLHAADYALGHVKNTLQKKEDAQAENKYCYIVKENR